MINARFLQVLETRPSYHYVSNTGEGILEMVFVLSQDFCFGILKFMFSCKSIIVFPTAHCSCLQDVILQLKPYRRIIMVYTIECCEINSLMFNINIRNFNDVWLWVHK